MSDTNTVSRLRQRMIEDMAARKLGRTRSAATSPVASGSPPGSNARPRYGNARRGAPDFSCTSSRAGRASATAIGS